MNKLKRFITFSSLAFMLIGAFYFFFLRTTPEERFHHATLDFERHHNRTVMIDMRMMFNEQLHEKTIRSDASNHDSYDLFLDPSVIESVSATGKSVTIDGVICEVLAVSYNKEKIAKPIATLIKQTSGAHGFGTNLFHEIQSKVYLSKKDQSLVGFDTTVDFPFQTGHFELSSSIK